jgi:hypothetical protein
VLHLRTGSVACVQAAQGDGFAKRERPHLPRERRIADAHTVFLDQYFVHTLDIALATRMDIP